MRILIISFFTFTIFSSFAQNKIDYDGASKLYTQVIRGERKFEDLSPNEKQQVLTIQQLTINSCGNLHGKCEVVCNAATELESAADNLSNCAKKHDYTNDCRRRYRDVKDKFEEYENAVSEASDDCS